MWVKHGEQEVTTVDISGAQNQEDEDEHDLFVPSPLGGEMVDVDHDLLQDMLRDVEDPAYNERDSMKFSWLVSDSKTPLYAGCKAKHTKLSGTLDLMKLKASSGWTDKSFIERFGIFKAMLPDENTLPETIYEAKQVLSPGVRGPLNSRMSKRLHIIPQAICGLRCLSCLQGFSIQAKKSADEGKKSKQGGPAKVVWYLTIIDRFKIIFANHKEAKLVRWHAIERRNDSMLRHPTNSI